jgi:hypothetical protein
LRRSFLWLLQIEMARNCLALLSRNLAVTAEENTIEAVTVKLPMLGVSLLPLEFRQVKDSMDVVRMALSARQDAYLNLPEIMEVAMLLGLNSPGDIARVEAAIAREAAGAGDFALAEDLCLGLVKKNHGEIWDLCAALARGSQTEGVDPAAHSPDTPRIEHKKYATFARHQLPRLLELSSNDNLRGVETIDNISHELASECSKPSLIATSLLVHGITNYGLVWSDHLVVNLALEALRSISNHSDIVGCGYLMNLKDAQMGAEVLEQEVGRHDEYEDSVKILHMAQLYAAVQDASTSSSLPSERREILLSSLSALKGPKLHCHSFSSSFTT